MVLVSTHPPRIYRFTELHGSKLACTHTCHCGVHTWMHQVCHLHAGPTYRPSHKNLDCASEHIYTLETLEQTAISVQSKNAFAFDSIEL